MKHRWIVLAALLFAVGGGAFARATNDLRSPTGVTTDGDSLLATRFTDQFCSRFEAGGRGEAEPHTATFAGNFANAPA